MTYQIIIQNAEVSGGGGPLTIPFDSDLDTLALAQAVLSAIQAANNPRRPTPEAVKAAYSAAVVQVRILPPAQEQSSPFDDLGPMTPEQVRTIFGFAHRLPLSTQRNSASGEP